MEETLGNIVDLVAKRMDADVCSVYLSDLDHRKLELAATKGLESEGVGRVSLSIGEGLVGLAAERATPIYTSNASEDPRARLFPQLGEERYQTLLAAPLRVGDAVVGVLVVQTQNPRDFSDADIALLDTCTQLITPMVMNAQVLALTDRDGDGRAAFAKRLAGQDRPRDNNYELRGAPTSRGIAIGPIHFLEDPLDFDANDYTPQEDPDSELADLMAAVAAARRELHGVRDEAGDRFGPEFAAVFNTHIQILEDKGFISRLTQGVAEEGNGITAIRLVREHYARMFERMEDPYFRERGADVEDVARRVTAKLLGVRHDNLPLSDGTILVTSNLLPAHFALLETERIAALVSEHGGPNSHGAIFARALEIPTVTGVTGVLDAMRAGELAIVDGGAGTVHLSPDEGLQLEFQRARERYAVAVEHLDALRDRPAETRDGRRVLLTANAGLLADLRHCEQHGAQGIGLFRTELLALAQRGFPPESEQEKLYERVAAALAPNPVTIRTLDLGGDKALAEGNDEENPQLGLRSIRLSLSNETSFRGQLRAILRASRRRNLRLLLPMISSLEELLRARHLLEETMGELSRLGEEFDAAIPVGVMVEVPAAALIAPALATHCDFFSIGTNDLTQYTLAVDRGNERVAHLYDPLHPSVLQLIARTVEAAAERDLAVSVCGEMATNPLAIPILVGLGIGELSGTPSAVPVVKEIVRALDSEEVAEDARRATGLGTAANVHRLAAERLRKVGLLEHPDIGTWLERVVTSVEADPGTD